MSLLYYLSNHQCFAQPGIKFQNPLVLATSWPLFSAPFSIPYRFGLIPCDVPLVIQTQSPWVSHPFCRNILPSKLKSLFFLFSHKYNQMLMWRIGLDFPWAFATFVKHVTWKIVWKTQFKTVLLLEVFTLSSVRNKVKTKLIKFTRFLKKI